MSTGALALFLDLARLVTPSGRERAAAEHCRAYLEALGLEVEEDGAGPQIGGDTGNLHVRIPATAPGTAIFLCSHLDTVPVDTHVEPVVEDGMVRNAAGSILGADNKASVAGMLDGIRRIVESGELHAGIELVLTPQEEVGLRGAKAVDPARLVSRCGFVYDHTGPIGGVITRAPTQKTLTLRFQGRAAHAGIEPESGASAILAAARAIAEMPQGRLDAGTTANVGLVHGGSARNVVAASCTVEAEARSLDHVRAGEVAQAMVDAATAAAALTGCSLEADVREEYRAYALPLSSPPGRIVRAALSAIGRTPSELSTGGGADSHIFNAAGIPCVNVCSGMMDVHTPDEWIRAADVDLLSDLTVAIVRAARDA